MKLIRGATCRLSLAGVEFIHRRRVVYCPWQVFNSLEEPRVPGAARAFILANPSALPQIEVWKNQDASAEEMLLMPNRSRLSADGLKAIQMCLDESGFWIVLPNLYGVNVRKLSELLVRLGRVLGPTQPSKSEGNS